MPLVGLPRRPVAARRELVLDSQTHSLVAQSLDSPLGAETVNGDGFGFGWYPTAGASTPGVFHSIEPAWHDQNLRELTQIIKSPLFFSHVRAAAGPPIQQTNCHPFRFENWLFMHNGTISEFPRSSGSSCSQSIRRCTRTSEGPQTPRCCSILR